MSSENCLYLITLYFSLNWLHKKKKFHLLPLVKWLEPPDEGEHVPGSSDKDPVSVIFRLFLAKSISVFLTSFTLLSPFLTSSAKKLYNWIIDLTKFDNCI